MSTKPKEYDLKGTCRYNAGVMCKEHSMFVCEKCGFSGQGHAARVAAIEEKMPDFIPCPFCGATPVDNDEVSSINPAAGGFELRHACFENIRGNYLSVRSVVVFGKTKAEVVERWNRRRNENK